MLCILFAVLLLFLYEGPAGASPAYESHGANSRACTTTNSPYRRTGRYTSGFT
jgi:hypothetical protein